MENLKTNIYKFKKNVLINCVLGNANSHIGDFTSNIFVKRPPRMISTFLNQFKLFLSKKYSITLFGIKITSISSQVNYKG